MTWRHDAEGLVALAERRESLAMSPLVERLAVLATFDPARIDHPDLDDVLRFLCERRVPSGDVDGRILRSGPRIDALTTILERGGFDELRATRQRAGEHTDSPLQRMLDAFVDQRDLTVAERTEDELLAWLEVLRWSEEALSRSGTTTQATTVGATRDEIEGRLEQLEVTRAIRALDEAGCIGRDAELERLHAYRREPVRGGLSEDPAFVVHGVGGIGKSTLIARFLMDVVREAERGEPVAWAYLDMDRPTLRSYHPDVIIDDVARQVAAQLTVQRRRLSDVRSKAEQWSKGSGLESIGSARSAGRSAYDVATSVRDAGIDALIVVLDTFEEVQRADPELRDQVHRLFALLRAELPGCRLIVSGRAPSDVFAAPDRPDRVMALGLFADAAAADLLRHFTTEAARRAGRSPTPLSDALADEVVAAVGGNPLTLKLAAGVLDSAGIAGVRDAAATAQTLDRVRSGFVVGFLYRRLLEHVGGPPDQRDDLRAIAKASIVLRRVTSQLLDEVVGPIVFADPAQRGSAYFDALGREVAFYTNDGAELRLRPEVRGPALLALRYEDETWVRRIHERALAFYATRDDEISLAERAYHVLALGEHLESVEMALTPALARSLEPSLADLPPAARPEVRALAQAAPDDTARAHDDAAALRRWERSVESEAEAAVLAGDLARARALIDERPDRSPASPLHAVLSRILEAEGDLGGAIGASERATAAAVAAGSGTRFAAAVVRIALLHERRGAPDRGADEIQADVGHVLIASAWELRLELQLNLIAMLERHDLLSADDRWSHGLEARTYLMKCDPMAVASSTALLRLLAAALGGEEPERLREAVDGIGLPYDDDPTRVRVLAAALADWDRSQTPPGSLAGAVGLTVEPGTALEQVWLTALSGLGVEAGRYLGPLWDLGPPPPAVLDAIRAFYLWWDVPPPSPDEVVTDHLREHFLDEVPLDFTRRETREFEQIILSAYPRESELRYLVHAASLPGGIDKQIDWTHPPRLIVRDLLTAAGRGGGLRQLAEFVLDDPRATSLHPALRALIDGT